MFTIFIFIKVWKLNNINSPKTRNISESRICQWESFWAFPRGINYFHSGPWPFPSSVFHVPDVEMSIGLGVIATLSKSWSCPVLIVFIAFLYSSLAIARFESFRVISWKNSCPQETSITKWNWSCLAIFFVHSLFGCRTTSHYWIELYA